MIQVAILDRLRLKCVFLVKWLRLNRSFLICTAANFVLIYESGYFSTRNRLLMFIREALATTTSKATRTSRKKDVPKQ